MDKKIIICEELRNAVIKRYKDNRRVSVKSDKDDIEDPVNTIFDMVEAINCLEENTFMFLNRHISEFVIPAEFKDFVLPNSVRYDVGNRSSTDILYRLSDKKAPTYTEYLNAIARVRALFRKGSEEDLVYLSELRKDMSFEDVRSRAAFVEGQSFVTRYEGIPFIPICLTFGKQFFENHYYNVTIDEPKTEFVNTFHN